VYGFYLGNNVIGIINNPKPQLAAWSFLTFALGSELRDKLLANTTIEADSDKEEDLIPIRSTHRSFRG
jgi:hypothetical protein